MGKSLERTVRQVIAGPRTRLPDSNVSSAIKFILQQQGKKSMDKADMSVTSGDEHDATQIMRRIHGSLVAEQIDEAKVAAEVATTLKADPAASKDNLAVMVAQALNRYSFLDKADDRGMLLLIAALQLLTISDGSDTINSTARRLIGAGLMQMKRK